MDFSVNAPIIYVIVGAIIALVLAQSIFFLARALKRAKQLGISSSTLKKTVSSAAIFTIAPAVAVLIGVVALSKSLGVALPWLRLSVIGSITYETVAAGNALEAAGMSAGITKLKEILSPNFCHLKNQITIEENLKPFILPNIKCPSSCAIV